MNRVTQTRLVSKKYNDLRLLSPLVDRALSLARQLLRLANMMQTGPKKTIHNWLDAVSDHLAVRRLEMRSIPRPKRNRERERARRRGRREPE